MLSPTEGYHRPCEELQWDMPSHRCHTVPSGPLNVSHPTWTQPTPHTEKPYSQKQKGLTGAVHSHNNLFPRVSWELVASLPFPSMGVTWSHACQTWGSAISLLGCLPISISVLPSVPTPNRTLLRSLPELVFPSGPIPAPGTQLATSAPPPGQIKLHWSTWLTEQQVAFTALLVGSLLRDQ